MNKPNPYRPPTAAVADVAVGRALPRAPVIALLAAGLLAVGWFASWMPGLFVLVGSASLNPMLGLLFLLGELCLAIGLWRAFPRGLRGRRSFALAIVLLALALVGMGFPRSFGLVFGPLIFAMAVSIAGLVLVHGRLRVTREQP
jgi:hypothetical protein